MRRLLVIAIFVFFIVAVASPFIIIPKILKIRRVECISQFGPCGGELLAKLAAEEGKSLFEAKKNLKTSLAGEFTIRDFSLRFKLPDRIEVAVILRKPKFALKSLPLNTFSLVDKEGFAVEIAEKTNLPRVEISSAPFDVGEKVDENLLFALEIIYEITPLYDIKRAVVEGDSLVVELDSGGKVIFPLEGDYAVLLGSLRLIFEALASAKIEGKSTTSVIDLRFKNPVIR